MKKDKNLNELVDRLLFCFSFEKPGFCLSTRWIQNEDDVLMRIYIHAKAHAHYLNDSLFRFFFSFRRFFFFFRLERRKTKRRNMSIKNLNVSSVWLCIDLGHVNNSADEICSWWVGFFSFSKEETRMNEKINRDKPNEEDSHVCDNASCSS